MTVRIGLTHFNVPERVTLTEAQKRLAGSDVRARAALIRANAKSFDNMEVRNA